MNAVTGKEKKEKTQCLFFNCGVKEDEGVFLFQIVQLLCGTIIHR